jgi:hypothetical protein
MFEFHSARIDTFRTMLAESDGTPTLVAVDSVGLGPLGITTTAAQRVLILPNPTVDGWVRIEGEAGSAVKLQYVFDARGRRVAVQSEPFARGVRIQLPAAPGLYFVQLEIDGSTVLKRMIRR